MGKENPHYGKLPMTSRASVDSSSSDESIDFDELWRSDKYLLYDKMIKKAIKTDNVGLVKTILDYVPDLIKLTNDWEDISKIINNYISLRMLTLLVDYGYRIKTSDEIMAIIENYGFEKSRPILDHRVKGDYYDPEKMIDTFYNDSVEALEWLRDSELPVIFSDEDFMDIIVENPDVDKVAIFFSTPSYESDGERWWSNIYEDFSLHNLVSRTNQRPRILIPTKWKIQADQIVNLFLQNVQTSEEDEIIQEFIDDYPQYEGNYERREVSEPL